VTARDPLSVTMRAVVRSEVAAYLAELGVGSVDYSSDVRPSGISRRAFNTACRSGKIAGAVRDGKIWRCSRAAWNEGRTRAPLKREIAKPMTDADRAQSFLKSAGLRLVGGSR
jgi:hypothetical protein